MKIKLDKASEVEGYIIAEKLQRILRKYKIKPIDKSEKLIGDELLDFIYEILHRDMLKKD